MTDPQYQRLCQGLASALRRDAELHVKQDYWQIGQGFLHYRSMLRQGGDHRRGRGQNQGACESEQ